MDWDLREAVGYYRAQGAPGDQNALISLLREAQKAYGGAIPAHLLPQLAEELGTKESLLGALVRRIPSLRLADKHCLELCAGRNCGKHAALTAFAETLGSDKLTIRFVGCMRQCGQGPNIRYDGTLYHRADEALLRRLTKDL